MAHLYENVWFYPKKKSIASKKIAKYLSDNNIHHAQYDYICSLPTEVANTKPALMFAKCGYVTDVVGEDGTRSIDPDDNTNMVVNSVDDLPADFSTKAESKTNYDAKQ